VAPAMMNSGKIARPSNPTAKFRRLCIPSHVQYPSLVILSMWFKFLGAFSKRKCYKRLIALTHFFRPSYRPYVCPHDTSCLQVEIFSWNFMFGVRFTEMFRENSNLVKIVERVQAPHMKTDVNWWPTWLPSLPRLLSIAVSNISSIK
jgi:hypothetical protein